MNQSKTKATTNTSLLLPDGRQLGYSEHGAHGGKPVFYFHGTPGSRHELDAEMLAVAARMGLRLICPERPGFGLSALQPGRILLDWAKDVEILADLLGIENFSVIGYSLGGVYALACAKGMPKRAKRLSLIGCFAPLNTPGVTQGMAPQVSGLLTLAHTDPDSLRNTLLQLAQSPAVLLSAMEQFMAASDKKILQQYAEAVTMNFSEALRQGVDAIVTEYALATRPWGFEPRDIKAKVDLWQGEQDCNAPPAMAAYLAGELPNHKMFMLPDEGHLALFTHWDDILSQLLIP
jgi:pimeloyl-ACP methyl ester carboxylesterase